MATRKRIRGKCFSLSGSASTKADAVKKAKKYQKAGQNVVVKKIKPYEIWVEC